MDFTMTKQHCQHIDNIQICNMEEISYQNCVTVMNFHCQRADNGTHLWLDKSSKDTQLSVLTKAALNVRFVISSSDCRFACLIPSVVTTTSVYLSSNKFQNGDILVPVNPDWPGKQPLNQCCCSSSSSCSCCYCCALAVAQPTVSEHWWKIFHQWN